MAFIYNVSISGDRVRSSVHECDSMDDGGKTYVRVPGVHGWVSRPGSEVFETRQACEFALIRALAATAKSLAEKASDCLK